MLFSIRLFYILRFSRHAIAINVAVWRCGGVAMRRCDGGVGAGREQEGSEKD